jgi:hypothetical protein
MDPITSSNAGSVASLTTSPASSAGSTAPESARVTDGGTSASAQAGRYGNASATAGSAEIPEPPAGPPDPGLGQEVLDRAFAEQAKLEKDLKGVDPTTPEGSKRMSEIIRQLNRMDEMIHMVNEMRKNRHDANMAVIANIAS